MKQTLSPLLHIAVLLLLVTPLHAQQQEEQWAQQHFPPQIDSALINTSFSLHKVITPVRLRKKQRAMRRLYDSPYLDYVRDSVGGEEKFAWLDDIEQYSISIIKEENEPDYVFLADLNGDGRKDIIVEGPNTFGIFFRDKWRRTYHRGNFFPHATAVALEFNRLDRRTQSMKRFCLRAYRGEDHYQYTSYTCSGFDKEFSRDSTFSLYYRGDDLLFLPYPLQRQAYVSFSNDSMQVIPQPPAQFPENHRSIYYGAVYAKNSSNGYEEWLVLDDWGLLRWRDARRLRK